jgi:2-dehydro-3-deoxyphosphooctonate aldolase (KDO 8-P synthase)
VKKVNAGSIIFGNDESFAVIAGLCVIEEEEHTLFVARELKKITDELGLPFCFKASFDKANRSSINSYRGPGMEKGLQILERVKKEINVPLLTDVHEVWQMKKVAEIVDILQIPAFLCRQTDLLVAAARTGRTVNIKKGQFLAPWDMKNIIKKLESEGCKKILLTERGASFGYNNLVSDMRSLVIMRSLGYPVVFDATHSVQLPGGKGDTTGGQREFVYPLSKAAVAVGTDALFFEVHEEPDKALSDGPNCVSLNNFKELLSRLMKIDRCIRSLE